MSRLVAITCQGVSKSFALVDGGNAWRLAFGAGRDIPVFHALQNVSFEVPKGQFVGVLGRNGAGKSTLLRVMGGVYSADSGYAAMQGAVSGIYELGLGGNPQLTGRQYSERILSMHGFSRRDQNEVIADIHDFSELDDRFDDPVLTYSTGMTARLFFATATAGRYAVYLLDEILSVGDQHFQSKCWRRLRDRLSTGASGVIVTHDWTAIARMCETAHVLHQGRIVYSGPAERAVRYYLYGETARSKFREGIARFAGEPKYPRESVPGALFKLTAEVEIFQPASVGCVFVIERLQPGFGWETVLMSRKVAPVAATPGRHQVEVEVPLLPLEPGSYQISIHLVMPDPDLPGRRIVLDGFGWLDGTGLALEIIGEHGPGLTLPVTWKVEH